MSKRPQPKSSGLGKGPLDPPDETPTEAPKQPEKKDYPHKMSFYLDVEDSEEVRGAFTAQFSQPDGDRSMTAFIAGAVMDKVKRLRDEINNGDEFPKVEAGGSKRGRPTGA